MSMNVNSGSVSSANSSSNVSQLSGQDSASLQTEQQIDDTQSAYEQAQALEQAHHAFDKQVNQALAQA